MRAAFALVFLLMLGVAAKAEADTALPAALRLIVSFPPGGSSGLIGEAVAQRLSERLERPITVTYIPGRGGANGLKALAVAPADGGTLALSGSYWISTTLGRGEKPKLSDFTTLGLIASETVVLAAARAEAIGDFDRLSQILRDPGAPLPAVATPGEHSMIHLAALDLAHRLDDRLRIRAFDGMAGSLAALREGKATLVMNSQSSMAPFLGTPNGVTPLLVMGPRRWPKAPDIPAAAEIGLGDTIDQNWHMLAAPPGLPPPIQAVLVKALRDVQTDPDWLAFLAQNDFIAETLTGRPLDTYLGQRIRNLTDRHQSVQPVWTVGRLALAGGAGLGVALLLGFAWRGFRHSRHLRRLKQEVLDRRQREVELMLKHEALEALMERAAAASQAKTQFMATMSHELRTPLNAIIGFSQLIGMKPQGPLGHPKYEEYIGCIDEAGRHLLDLVNEILDMAAIETRRLTIEERPFDLGQELTQVANRMQVRTVQSRIDLRLDLPNAACRVMGDAKRLRQAILNVIGNAIKFSPEGGLVTVSLVAKASGGVAIVIADQGIGMSADEIERALRPYERLQTDPRYDGIGLGLSIARAIVELHQGEIVIESGKGEGTRVLLNLPAGRLLDGSNAPESQAIPAAPAFHPTV